MSKDRPLENMSRDDLLRLSEVHNRATRAENRVTVLETTLKEICGVIEVTDDEHLYHLRELARSARKVLRKRDNGLDDG